MKLNNVLVVYMKFNYGALDIVKTVLEKYNIKYKDIIREKLRPRHIKKKKMVIVVGGDGTFLRTASYIKDNTPILGVNANIKKKEGFFTRANKFNFKNKLKLILKNKEKIIKLTRLQAKINNKPIKELALNEFYIGTDKAYDVSRYILKIKNKKEFQKSSGILVSTAAGSTGWASSCGSKRLPLTSKYIQYFVRDPYHGKHTNNYKLLRGILDNKTKITICPEIDLVIVADSLNGKHKIKFKDKVEISASNKPLYFVYF